MRIGLAGLGSIGRRHFQTLESLPSVGVTAVADPSVAADGPAPPREVPVFASYEEMLEEAELDAVLLCTPSFLHADQGVAASRRGLHVIAEKPMAITLEGADAVLEASAEGGVHVAVLHQYRFHAPIVALRQLIANGTLGDVVFLNIAFNWRRDPEYYEARGGWRGTWDGDGGGALMNQGAHAVDLARWLGGRIATVTAHTANVRHQIEAEDTVCVALEFAGGGLGTIQVTTCAARNQPVGVRYEGTAGSAILADQTLVVNGDAAVEPPIGPPSRTLAHRAQFVEIFRALANGGTPPVAGADARATLAATLAMYESARAGRAVSLET
jgi:UDP-N-acetyl-2-amino-2-deoxyglucuronate dehydrogenase